MVARAAELSRLCLLVERLLDADLVVAEEGAALLAEARGARQSLEAGDAAAARGHVAEVVQFTERLVRTGALNAAEGRAILETTRRLLDGS